MQTLSAFGKSVDWVRSGKFTQQDIDEAKLSVFSAVDSPVAPADKGAKIFFSCFRSPGNGRRILHTNSYLRVCCRNEPVPEWSHG